MESKKINQLATNVAPQTSDLTIIGDPVTGVSKKITLLQIADLFATTGTVTSVAVTETGDALTITGSPITSAGTINIGFAGDATQYVRGDGALADFPTSTGGGSSVSYYLNSSVSQGTIGGVAYRELSKDPISGAGTDITISSNGYVASYITDANDPSLLEVPGGNFNCEFYFSVNSNAHNPSVYAELYKYDGTTFTLLGSSQSVPEYLTNGTTLSPYYFAIPVATAALTITDRLAIRIYVNVDTRVVTLHTENNHLCQVVTTFSKGLTSLNNLTRQVQFLATGTSGTDFNISSSTATHTFNLPVASATNTGKLSSTDWSTFNSKQNAITLTTTGTSGAATLVGATLNIPNYGSALSDYVTLATTQTISGSKTFSDFSVFNQSIYANAEIRLVNAGTSSTTNLQNVSSVGVVSFGANMLGFNTNKDLYISSDGKGYSVFSFNNAGTGYTYTFQNRSGTVALTDQLTSGTVTSVGLSSATSGVTIGSTPITSSGTITLAIATASGSQNGLLSSTDWNTFNGKQNALTNPITGTGTTNYVPKFTASGTIGNSLIYDTGTRIAIGGTDATYGVLTVQSDAGQFCIQSNTTPGKQLQIGYDHTTNNSYLSSLNQGVAFTPLALQPNGGNVGIGTSIPNLTATNRTTLDINGTNESLLGFSIGGTFRAYIYNTASDQIYWTEGARNMQFGISGAAFMGFGTNNSERMRITSGGNVGIGTTSPIDKLTVSGRLNILGTNQNSIWFNQNAGGTSTGFLVGRGYTSADTQDFFIYDVAAAAPRLQITSGGNVLIGTTAAETAALTALAPTQGTCAIQGRAPNGTSAALIQSSSVTSGSTSWYAYVAQSGNGSSVTTNTMFVYGNGNIVNVNNSYGTLSDIALKENIIDATSKLDDILKLKVKNFNLIADENKTKQIGFIAQDLEQVFPNMIEIDSKSGMKSIKTSVLIPMLVKAIQELKAELDELKNK
jgi:hypothetical protein